MPIQDCVATTIDCGISTRKYMKIGKRANRKRRCKPFQPQSKIAKYKREKCTPKNIRMPNDYSIEIDLQDALNHGASKIMTPEMVKKMKYLKAKGATFLLYFKYGNSK